MFKEGLLEVRELEKGVDAITRVDMANPLVRQHKVPEDLQGRVTEMKESTPQLEYVPPLVREMYCVTASVADLFAPIKWVHFINS